MIKAMRAGIDLGGTKIEIAVLNEDNNFLLRERILAPQGDYATTIQAIKDLVATAESKLGVMTRIGVCVPGTISPATGLMKNANSVWLNGKPLDRDLEQAIERRILIANDANCFALSEAVDGAGREANIVFGVILGTGVGGGIVINQDVLSGAQSIAGEWGHNLLPFARPNEQKPPICYCGRRGCIETYLSGPALAADYARMTGLNLAPADIAQLAENGDPTACASMNRYFDRLARALGIVVNILDPDLIVLGGGLSNIDAIYEEVPQRLAEFVFSDSCVTRITKNAHGDSSGVRGAAWLWEPRCQNENRPN
jgi:fructokinase